MGYKVFFGCQLLLEILLEWKQQLQEAGKKYLGTNWTLLSDLWPELELLFHNGGYKNLNERPAGLCMGAPTGNNLSINDFRMLQQTL